MKTIDIRRHAMRRKPGPHLSPGGIELAKFATSQMSPYNCVFTSTLPRSIETAMAMGYQVDEHIEELGIIPDQILAKLNWPNTFQNITRLINTDSDCFQFAREQASIWFDCVKDLPDESQILIISHGGIIELGALGSVQQNEPVILGEAIGYCEGIRLKYKNENCVGIYFERMPEDRRLIDSK